MQRRRFLQTALLSTGPFILRAAGNQGPAVAITLDDMNFQGLPDPKAADARLLGALKQQNVRAFLYVIGRNADSEDGQRIVSTWRAAGHTIGNHTYSHRNYNSVSFADFSADIAKAEAVLTHDSERPHWFRFPVLKEGNTAEKRDAMRGYLAENGYRNGHVTIDASDWYYDQRLRERLKREPDFDVQRYRQPYLAHLWDRAQYYDELGKTLTGRHVTHTILLHYNLINSLFLGQVCQQFRDKGWRVVDAAEAYRDPVFTRQPQTVPAGESLLWALAKETGRYESRLRYPGEDDAYEKPKLDALGL